MNRPLTVVSHPSYRQYSEIIDVRSPSEFAEDHVPGAINLWVLNDQQRAEVGTLYKQVGAFEAKKLGSALMARNIAHWLETHLAGKSKDYHPLVYCWRGGQRSEGMATILSRISWDTHLLQGGYKNYRNQVLNTLDTKASQLKLRVISGLTGTGKTRLLQNLKDMGEQVLDLEGLANHRGSLLGHDPNSPQPAQKYFESLLAQEITGFDVNRTTWIEAESNKIGNLHCPNGLWKNMKQAEVIQLEATLDDRVRFLLHDYTHFVDEPGLVLDKLEYLKSSRGAAKVEHWGELLKHGETSTFVEDILINHYDIGYTKSIAKNRAQPTAEIRINPTDPTSVAMAAEQLRALP